MLRLKLKFCTMCDSFLDRSESFPVRKDNAARIGIADLIIEWTRELKNVSTGSLSKYTHVTQPFSGKRWLRQCICLTA